MQAHIVSVTITTDTSAYADGDQIGTKVTVLGAAEAGGAKARLKGVTVVDKTGQSAALDVLLFSEDPTVASADQAAANVADAELVDKLVGVVSVAAANYVALSAGSVAHVGDLDRIVKVDKDNKLYALVVSGGTPTYTSASDLVLKFHFEW